MEILNILYNNNYIAFYLIGAILVVILIFIVISSMSTTPKNNEELKENKILEDPMEKAMIPEIIDSKPIDEPLKEEKKESVINEMVEDLYQQKLQEDEIIEEENQDLSSFLEEFEVPEQVIVNNIEPIKEEKVEDNLEVENVVEQKQTENIESMLKRLYDLRQNENNTRKQALLNEIYDLKKQVDEKIKSDYSYSLDYNNIDTKALADYYLFNEDIEFPKLK